MKLIYIHIPKTAGSSVSHFLARQCRFIWLANGELDKVDNTQAAYDLDCLAGHIRLEEINNWAVHQAIDLSDTRLFTIIRHPLDQLQSNLNFPFELRARGLDIPEQWMRDLLAAGDPSPESLANLFELHPWLLNLQWQYLVTGSSLDEALGRLDHVSVFPGVDETLHFACDALLLDPAEIPATLHENASRYKFISRSHFGDPGLRSIILDKHNLDFELFRAVARRQMKRYGLQWAEPLCSVDFATFYEAWLDA